MSASARLQMHSLIDRKGVTVEIGPRDGAIKRMKALNKRWVEQGVTQDITQARTKFVVKDETVTGYLPKQSDLITYDGKSWAVQVVDPSYGDELTYAYTLWCIGH
jgi:hypothetical protein